MRRIKSKIVRVILAATLAASIFVGNAISAHAEQFVAFGTLSGWLTGQYPSGVIDWGKAHNWYVVRPDTANNLPSMVEMPPADSGNDNRQFTVLNNHVFSGIDIYNYDLSSEPVDRIICSSDISLQSASAGLPSATLNAQNVTVPSYVRLKTNWERPCTIVTLAASNGHLTHYNLLDFDGSPSVNPVVLGSNQVYSGGEGSSGQTVAAAFAYSANQNVNVAGFHLYDSCAGGSGVCAGVGEIGIYTDDSLNHQPGTLMTKCAFTESVNDTWPEWVSCDVAASVGLTTGTTYWLAVFKNVGIGFNTLFQGSGNCQGFNSQANEVSNLPATWVNPTCVTFGAQPTFPGAPYQASFYMTLS